MADNISPSSSHVPSTATAERVKSLVRAFIPVERIAKILQINLAELKKHYPYELGFTDDEELANVADTAYAMAVSGRFPDMTKWWLKVKGGVKFNENIVELDPNNKPLLVIMAGEYEGDEERDITDESELVSSEDNDNIIGFGIHKDVDPDNF